MEFNVKSKKNEDGQGDSYVSDLGDEVDYVAKQ